jgi:hypothetical protein
MLINSMETIKITNSRESVSPGLNFEFYEFWHTLLRPLDQDFDLFACIPQALQVFRNYYNKIWWVNSAWRPTDDPRGPHAHLDCPPAVDSQSEEGWPEVMADIRNELKNWRTSDLVKKVLETGVNCIIIEHDCLHIHYRTEYNSHPVIGDELGEDMKGKSYDLVYTDGLYLGEWQPKAGDPRGENTIYSI